MSEQVKRYQIKYAGECRITGYGPTVEMVAASDYDALHAEAEALRAENGRLSESAKAWGANCAKAVQDGRELRSQLEAARGLLHRLVTACDHAAYGKALHDAREFITATPAPEVQACGPYASVSDALAQRYPKPSLLKDCNVTYSNSSLPLAEQGERQAQQGGSNG